ncbi:MAG: alpha/beta fold hydrolase [Phycisphaerales bacterium]
MDWPGLAIILLEGLALAIVLCAWWIARRIRRPPRRTYASAVSRGQPGDPSELETPREFSAWSLEWKGVGLPVWEIPGDDPEGPVVVCTPGWADSKIGALSRLPAVLPVASRVIAWDPPGLGESPDWPRGPFGGWPMGTADADALGALIERVGAERVALFGWSAGAGTSIVAASSRASVACVIAEAPYRMPWTPARNVLRAMGMPWTVVGPLAFGALGVRFGMGPRWNGRGGFDRAAHAERVGCPLLVLHGDEDEVCPLADGEAIAKAAPKGQLAVIPGGRHNDLWTDDALRERCAAEIRGFLTSVRAR